MPVIRIDDGADPRLADYAGVREPRLLREREVFIAEGRFVVRRLLGSSRVRFRSLLLNDAALGGLSAVLSTASDLPVYVASPQVIACATGFDIHRGCLGLADRLLPVSLDATLAASQLLVVLERVVDADNVGAIFRNAEAFGADAVLLSPGCCDPLYRKAMRTSSGAAAVVPFAEADPWLDTLDRLHASGFTVAALTPASDAADIGAFVQTAGVRSRIALLAGTEGNGLTEDALQRASVRLRIPMRSSLDSLNVATALAIALHRLDEARGE